MDFNISKDELKRLGQTFFIHLTLPLNEVKYFHPSGTKIPNGIQYQRGGFLNECRANKACGRI